MVHMPGRRNPRRGYFLKPELTAFERALVLSSCPRGTRIAKARYFQHHAYPCPVRVTVLHPDGSSRDLALRGIRHRMGRLERETALYPVLARLGLPVPAILAGPARDSSGHAGARVVLSVLPGETLQHLSARGGRNTAKARELLLEAITWLHRLTPRVEADKACRVVPRGGLATHLGTILKRRGRWMGEELYSRAARKLMPVLERIRTPLVFSNGDYQPGNFLASGGRLSGILDFEYAWFEDPLYGFTKYPIYDLAPLNKAGVVEAYLKRRGMTKKDFAPRLALACLATLDREVPVSRGPRRYRRHILRLLDESLRQVAQ
jgi:hypothetical protein